MYSCSSCCGSCQLPRDFASFVLVVVLFRWLVYMRALVPRLGLVASFVTVPMSIDYLNVRNLATLGNEFDRMPLAASSRYVQLSVRAANVMPRAGSSIAICMDSRACCLWRRSIARAQREAARTGTRVVIQDVDASTTE